MQSEIMQWITFGANMGISVVIVAVMIIFFVKYGPSLIAAHLTFVQAATTTLEALPEIDKQRLNKLDVLSNEHELHLSESQKTNRALSKACDLIDVYATGATNAGEIRQHTHEIRKALHE